MTEHFRQFMFENIGVGSGTKRYSDMVRMLKEAGYPIFDLKLSHNKQIMGVSAETIQAMKGFTDDEWDGNYFKYLRAPRTTTRGLSRYGLAEIRRLVSEYNPEV